jgi:hypothetical protein
MHDALSAAKNHLVHSIEASSHYSLISEAARVFSLTAKHQQSLETYQQMHLRIAFEGLTGHCTLAVDLPCCGNPSL